MKILSILFTLGLVSIISGCEGMCVVSPTYQPTNTLTYVTEGKPIIKLEVRDGREKKIFLQTPVSGYITDDGRGGPFRLFRPTKEIFEQAFSQALNACNYAIRQNTPITYQVNIEKFMVIQHRPEDPIFGVSGKLETSVTLGIKVISDERVLATRKISQKDTGKFPSDSYENLLTRSLSSAVEQAVQDRQLAGIINNEHYRLWRQWEKALIANTIVAYQDFIEENPESFYVDEAKAKIVDLEVDEIMGQHHGKLPTLREMERIKSREYSVINIHNGTSYNLTIRYSGPDSFKAIFEPAEKGSVELRNGNYRLAASVDALHVKNYAGQETLTGGNYQVKYYIVTTGPFSFTPPKIPALPKIPAPLPDFSTGTSRFKGFPKFDPWPSKRKLPAEK